jgi:lipopolysaccharide export LptBFGC system permease protein LptF
MKKVDKLILTSFLGPFVLTFLVVVFISTQHPHAEILSMTSSGKT